MNRDDSFCRPGFLYLVYKAVWTVGVKALKEGRMMVIPLLLAGKFLYDLNEASNIDEEAKEYIDKAIARESEAQLLVKKEAFLLERCLEKVANERQKVVEQTLPLFVKVYEKTENVVIDSGKSLVIDTRSMRSVGHVTRMALQTFNRLSEKEDIRNMLLGGVGGLVVGAVGAGVIVGIGHSIKQDSKRYLSVARRQLSAANELYDKAEDTVATYKALSDFADRMAAVTARMNLLFLDITKRCMEVIDEREAANDPYSEADVALFVACANMAALTNNILVVPIADDSRKITDDGHELIASSEKILADAMLMCKAVGIAVDAEAAEALVEPITRYATKVPAVADSMTDDDIWLEMQKIIDQLKACQESFAMSHIRDHQFKVAYPELMVRQDFVESDFKNNGCNNKSKLMDEIEAFFLNNYYSEKARYVVLRRRLANFKVEYLSPYYTPVDDAYSAYYVYYKDLVAQLHMAWSRWNQLVEPDERLYEEWLDFEVFPEHRAESLASFEGISTSSRIQKEAYGYIDDDSTYLSNVELRGTDNDNFFWQESNAMYYEHGFREACEEYMKDFAEGISSVINYESDYAKWVNKAIDEFVKNVKAMLEQKIVDLEEFRAFYCGTEEC